MWSEKTKQLWIRIQVDRARAENRGDLSAHQLRRLARHRREVERREKARKVAKQ